MRQGKKYSLKSDRLYGKKKEKYNNIGPEQ